MISFKLHLLTGAACLALAPVECSFGQVSHLCTDDVKFSLGSNCNQYVKCFKGKLHLHLCSEGRIYDDSKESCIQGVFTGCHPILKLLKSGNLFVASSEIGESSDDARDIKAPVLPFDKMYNSDKINIEPDDKVTDTVSETNLWTYETDYTSNTATEWTNLEITTDKDLAITNQVEWSSTQINGAFGNLFEIRTPSFNRRNYFLSESGTMVTLSEMNMEQSSTRDADQLDTDSTGMTATEWPNLNPSSAETSWINHYTKDVTKSNPILSTIHQFKSSAPPITHTTAKPTKSSNHTTHTTVKPTKSSNHTTHTTVKPTKSSNHTIFTTVKPIKSSSHTTHTTVKPTKLSNHTTHTTVKPTKSSSHPTFTTVKSTKSPFHTKNVHKSTRHSFTFKSKATSSASIKTTKAIPSTSSTVIKTSTVPMLWPFEYEYYDELVSTDASKTSSPEEGYNSANNSPTFPLFIIPLLLLSTNF